MQQIWFFHGGESYSSYDAYIAHLKDRVVDLDRLRPSIKWRNWIAEQLPDADCLMPTMPDSDNAVYDEWKILFEKFIPFFDETTQLVGHSLGAMFLAKYFHEHQLEQPIHRIILVAAGYDKDLEDYGSFKIQSAKGVDKSAREVHLFHSVDDPAVPFGELAKFVNDLPSATAHEFTDRGHFLASEFPELLDLLKQK